MRHFEAWISDRDRSPELGIGLVEVIVPYKAPDSPSGPAAKNNLVVG